MTGALVLSGAVTVAFGLLVLALLTAFVRLVRGPSLPDRVVALELVTALVVGFIALYAVATRQAVFLDTAIALALVSFVGTVAFARYLERRGVDDD